MKLDILAFAAHPDDAELGCGGTLLKHIAEGRKVGIIDLTKGELGTRGSAEIREQESNAAAKILGITVRANLALPDGIFELNAANKSEIVRMIRTYQPELVLANAILDRHPDHGRASQLVSESVFLAGLVKFSTNDEQNIPQQAWKPRAVYHYIQDRYIKPDIIIDITPFMEQKMAAIMAYSSQFFNPDSKEPITPIATKEFLDFLSARAMDYGRIIGVPFGEGFTTERPAGVASLFDLR